MNTNLKQGIVISSTIIATVLSTIASASATTIYQPGQTKGCFCGDHYYPPNICRVMRCMDFTMSERSPLNEALNQSQQVIAPVQNNHLVAGRYRTRSPGGGIGGGGDA